MSLLDFMDESSEMFMEARDGEKEADRVVRKAINGGLNKDDEKKVTDHLKKTDNRAYKSYNSSSIKMKEDPEHAHKNMRNNDGVQKVASAMDAMDRHRRRHKHEGAIEFI